MRTQIVATARRMRELGLVTHTVGNVSARADAGMLITPTRVHPDDLDPAQIVELTLDGHGTANPSLEWRLHAAIYQARSDVHAIVHTHSPHAVARSFDPTPLIVETEERTYLELDRVDVVPHAPAGSAELADAVAETLADRPAVLLARHGVIGTGPTPRDALEICCVVEHQAQIAYLVHALRLPAEV